MKTYFTISDRVDIQGIEKCKKCSLKGQDCMRTGYKIMGWLKFDSFKCTEKQKSKQEEKSESHNKDLVIIGSISMFDNILFS